MPWNRGGMGAGIGCAEGESCTVTGSGTITATLRWVYNDGDTTTAPYPPAQIAIVEFPRADCSAQIMNGSLLLLSASETANDGANDPATQSVSGNAFVDDSSGGHYSLVNSSSGVITKTATLSCDVTASIPADTNATGYASPSFAYSVVIVSPHAHPINYRRTSATDIGGGQPRFTYQWDSDDGILGDLSNCSLYEKIVYSGDGHNIVETDPNTGRMIVSFQGSNPPFDAGWKFPQPSELTFAQDASIGAATDTHYRPGNFNVPLFVGNPTWQITGRQQYRYQCSICGANELIPGPSSTATIVRKFEPVDEYVLCQERSRKWKFSTTKDGFTAWLELTYQFFYSDSIGTNYP